MYRRFETVPDVCDGVAAPVVTAAVVKYTRPGLPLVPVVHR
jgi:hypothetical protein